MKCNAIEVGDSLVNGDGRGTGLMLGAKADARNNRVFSLTLRTAQ